MGITPFSLEPRHLLQVSHGRRDPSRQDDPARVDHVGLRRGAIPKRVEDIAVTLVENAYAVLKCKRAPTVGILDDDCEGDSIEAGTGAVELLHKLAARSATGLDEEQKDGVRDVIACEHNPSPLVVQLEISDDGANRRTKLVLRAEASFRRLEDSAHTPKDPENSEADDEGDDPEDGECGDPWATHVGTSVRETTSLRTLQAS